MSPSIPRGDLHGFPPLKPSKGQTKLTRPTCWYTETVVSKGQSELDVEQLD